MPPRNNREKHWFSGIFGGVGEKGGGTSARIGLKSWKFRLCEHFHHEVDVWMIQICQDHDKQVQLQW